MLEIAPFAATTKGLIRHPSTGGSGFVRLKARPQRSMRGSFAKDGQSGSSLPQRAVSRRRKLTHARTGANCGKDALQNRARLEDGISIVRDLSVSVVRPAMRTEHATSYSASTAPCRRGARSRPSWRCGPSATMEFITCRLVGAIDG